MILLLISFIIKKKNSPFHPGRGFFLNGSLQAAFFEHAVLPDIQPEKCRYKLARNSVFLYTKAIRKRHRSIAARLPEHT